MMNSSKTQQNVKKETPEDILNRWMFVTREEWKADKPKMKKRLKLPIPYVVFSYSNSLNCENKADCMQRVLGVQTCNMHTCGMPDIKFNFLIGGDGRVYEGRGWNYAGNKYDPTDTLSPLNEKNIEIAFICSDDNEPTKEMGEAAATLILYGISKNFLKKDVKVTTLWNPHTIPKQVKKIENLIVSRHVKNNKPLISSSTYFTAF